MMIPRFPKALAVMTILFAAPVVAERPPIEITDGSRCATVAARYVALLEDDGNVLVLSAAPFPGSHVVPLSEERALVEPISGHPEVGVSGDAAQVHGLEGREISSGVSGCIGFDKDRFTWASDLLTYVSYLAGLLREAQRLDPAQRSLVVSDRTVKIEVRRPGGDFAVLEGVEGSMLGFGRPTDAQRYFLVPVLLGPTGDAMLVHVLRNEGAAFGERATGHFAWVLLTGDEATSTATDPPLTIRRLR